MSKENNLTDFLTDVADAIREKKGSSEKINPQNFSKEIKNLPSGEEVNTFGEVMVDKTGMGKTINTKIIVAEGVETIADNAYTNLLMSEVVFPYGLKTIGGSSFYNCLNLMKADIPNSVTFVAGYAFRACSKLKNHRFPENVTVVKSATYINSGIETFVSDGKLTAIDSSAFGSSKLTFLVLRGVDSVATLAVNALQSTPIANGAGYIYIPDSLVGDYKAATNWSAYADQIRPLSEYVYLDFADPVVEKICAENFGDGIGTTQAQANAVTTFPAIFKGNTEITSFDEFEKFENVTSIGTDAFYGCENLIKIKIPQKTEVLAQACFSNCKNLTEINLERVKSLNQSALQKCTSIKEISMPNLVGEVPYMCFYYMSSLEKVLDLGSITVVGASAFQFCRKLTYIKLPSTVVTINGAFGYCSSLSTLIVDTPYPPTLMENAFKDSPSISIYVPDESVGAYKSATNWSAYAEKIKPLSEYQPITE